MPKVVDITHKKIEKEIEKFLNTLVQILNDQQEMIEIMYAEIVKLRDKK